MVQGGVKSRKKKQTKKRSNVFYENNLAKQFVIRREIISVCHKKLNLIFKNYRHWFCHTMHCASHRHCIKKKKNDTSNNFN